MLYVLLAKKPPNNPDVVGDRREIALMAQEMKILLQASRLQLQRTKQLEDG